MSWGGNGNAERKLRARLRAEGRPCHICGMPIDYSLPPGDPWSFEDDYGNLDAAHRICNQRKGAHVPGDGRPTEIRRTRLF